MSTSQLTRNLRDGELIIRDGDAAALTVVLDDGDLTWTETVNTVEVKDRGAIATGHTRPGDDASVELSFTAKWTVLAGGADDPLGLYEVLSFSRDGLVSTSPAGQQQTLTLEFRVADPAGGDAETITFPKVYRQSLTMSEGEDANRIAFSGRAFVTRPNVTAAAA